MNKCFQQKKKIFNALLMHARPIMSALMLYHFLLNRLMGESSTLPNVASDAVSWMLVSMEMVNDCECNTVAKCTNELGYSWSLLLLIGEVVNDLASDSAELIYKGRRKREEGIEERERERERRLGSEAIEVAGGDN
uniref:Uncharacterized protein n=1 Tax=Nelumbo nucifera TaxID=4432 RepID=A0A822ZRL0_NELNU|nr:TPA_asm: hypothetical protein HUJ06_004285 [Nelumbo nucifera]